MVSVYGDADVDEVVEEEVDVCVMSTTVPLTSLSLPDWTSAGNDDGPGKSDLHIRHTKSKPVDQRLRPIPSDKMKERI